MNVKELLRPYVGKNVRLHYPQPGENFIHLNVNLNFETSEILTAVMDDSFIVKGRFYPSGPREERVILYSMCVVIISETVEQQ